MLAAGGPRPAPGPTSPAGYCPPIIRAAKGIACPVTVWAAGSGMADTQQPALQDRDRSGQAGEFGEAGQVADRDGDGGGGLIGHAQHHDARVAAGWIGADIT